jgi:hypothetical protein
MNRFQPAKRLCADMIDVYEHLTTAARYRRAYAHSWIDFIFSVQQMTLTQLPELKDSFTELGVLIEQLSQIHRNLADKEERTAEDLRDVYERFEAVFRISEDLMRRRGQYQLADKDLIAAHVRISLEQNRPDFEKKRTSLEQALLLAKTNKTEAIKHYKDGLMLMIEQKDLYNKFKVRRLSHGWHLYASAVKEAAQQELELFAKIRDHLETLDGVIEDVTGVLELPVPIEVEVIQSAVQGLPEPDIFVRTAEPEREPEMAAPVLEEVKRIEPPASPEDPLMEGRSAQTTGDAANAFD